MFLKLIEVIKEIYKHLSRYLAVIIYEAIMLASKDFVLSHMELTFGVPNLAQNKTGNKPRKTWFVCLFCFLMLSFSEGRIGVFFQFGKVKNFNT